jgi:hypothetical protein
MFISRVVFLGALALALTPVIGSACSSAVTEASDAGADRHPADLGSVDAGSDALPPGCDPPPFTYASFGMAFIANYCFSCHGFNQSDVRQLAPTILDYAVNNTYMPPSDPKPTPAERMNLGAWINCGAP